MKIAIPCENGEVMQHFGHATEFTVYTIEDIKPIEKETVTFDDTDHEKVAGGLNPAASISSSAGISARGRTPPSTTRICCSFPA